MILKCLKCQNNMTAADGELATKPLSTSREVKCARCSTVHVVIVTLKVAVQS